MTPVFRTGQSSGVAALGCYRGDMWVLDPPGGYPGKARFLGRPWAKVLRWDPEKVFLGVR